MSPSRGASASKCSRASRKPPASERQFHPLHLRIIGRNDVSRPAGQTDHGRKQVVGGHGDPEQSREVGKTLDDHEVGGAEPRERVGLRTQPIGEQGAIAVERRAVIAAGERVLRA